jgi:hypothetical protein
MRRSVWMTGGTVDNHDVHSCRRRPRSHSTANRATGRHNGAARTSRRHAYRNVRARTPRPRPGARHQGWPRRLGRCRCARGHPCRRSQPAHRRRAARLRSGQAAPRPGPRAGGSRATGATAIPTGRQAAADRVDRRRRLGWVRLGAGARGRGPEPADPTAAGQCRAPRGPTVHPQPGSYSRRHASYGETYVYDLIRCGGAMLHHGRWITGEEAVTG